MPSNKKGFTLIEVLVAIIILAIGAAVALPNFATYINDAKVRATQNNLQAILSLEKNYFLDHTAYCDSACDSLANINTNLGLNLSDTNYTYSCDASSSLLNNSGASLVCETSNTSSQPNSGVNNLQTTPTLSCQDYAASLGYGNDLCKQPGQTCGGMPWIDIGRTYDCSTCCGK